MNARDNSTGGQFFVTISAAGVAYEMHLPDAGTDYIQKNIANSGVPYELEMLEDMAGRLSPGDLVLDVGANIGNHALYLVAAAQAHVIAFEPNTHLVSALRKSVDQNGYADQLLIESVGLGRERGLANFKEEIPSNLGAQSLRIGDGSIQVVPIDDLSIERHVCMIKIDVEGMELDVLAGAGELISRDRPLIYVESQDEKSFLKLSRWANANGYVYWESFNISPTHLFRPRESVAESERFDRLVEREVIQEYRLGVLLRRARRFQRAAETDATALRNQLEEVVEAKRECERMLVAQKEKHEMHEAELLAAHDTSLGLLNRKLQDVGGELKDLKLYAAQRHARLKRAYARIQELEQSSMFRLGQVLIEGVTSFRGFVRFPYSLGRLLARGVRRRFFGESRAAPQCMPSLPAPDMNLVVENWLASHPEAKGAVSLLYADINLNIVDGSSIWLSSAASILCAQGPCVLVSKVPTTRDVVISNVRTRENLIVIDPSVAHLDVFSVPQGLALMRALDARLSGVRAVVVRGLDVASGLLSNRQFYGRAAVYITDFFKIGDAGRFSTEEQRNKLSEVLANAGTVLVQTPQVRAEMERLTGLSFTCAYMPPVVPDVAASVGLRERSSGERIKIGYAGKINSRWGVIELLDWVERLVSSGIAIDLHIVADKISNGPDPEYMDLSRTVPERIRKLGARHYKGMNREASMNLMSEMDFVWCYRPTLLEDNTLELSTKLVEMVALGARCVCYPNEINQDVLGSDYPYFISDESDFAKLLTRSWGELPAATVGAVRSRHSLGCVGDVVRRALFPEVPRSGRPVVCFAGNDFKFIDPYVSRLKREGVPVLRDEWEWGAAKDLAFSEKCRDEAEVVFCEWGLANAVWYSKNIRNGQRLIVRIHAQEVRERARKFGRELNVDAIEKIIFVSSMVRDKAIELWGWPEEKTIVIPNFVLDENFKLLEHPASGVIRLGMVGIVPQLKRFDRALDLLEALLNEGREATLRIKGHRPESLSFMTVPARAAEMQYYYDQYNRIENDPKLRGRVFFDPWGNDVAAWYGQVDYILSSSDTESFHYALADGVLAGCYPVIWVRPGIDDVFDPNWVVEDTRTAVHRVQMLSELSDVSSQEEMRRNREFIVNRYSCGMIFSRLDAEVFS